MGPAAAGNGRSVVATPATGISLGVAGGLARYYLSISVDTNMFVRRTGSMAMEIELFSL